MRFRWPTNIVFERVFLNVEQTCCAGCGCALHVCGHRRHRIYTLKHPVELYCRLAHCSDPACPTRPTTLSPDAELDFTLPGWLIGWDVFCFIGHRRFARHWSVPPLRAELSDTYQIRLSADAIAVYCRRCQAMLAARQQDRELLRLAYHDLDDLWLSIDGLQPEKGHETLYAVRELKAGRVWFAEALLSSSQDEVRRLRARARDFAQDLGKVVRLWVSDKQDAFVKGIAAAFPGVPHRHCRNHFRRDLAKPTLASDSQAKVQMRKKVRGLREIERPVLRARPVDPEVSGPVADGAGPVVLDYCGAVRGILNDDRGGPLHPPGLRMAHARAEVRPSLARLLGLHKPGAAHGQLARLSDYSDAGLAVISEQQGEITPQVAARTAVAETLTGPGTLRQRRAGYRCLLRRYQWGGGAFYGRLANVMKGWQAGLFVAVPGRGGQPAPSDNLELERWFRLPKGHERRIHGHSHAGVRIVQEGATLLLVLNAPETHPGPFTAQDLLPCRHAREPTDQLLAIRRRKIMRKARSQNSDRSCSLS